MSKKNGFFSALFGGGKGKRSGRSHASKGRKSSSSKTRRSASKPTPASAQAKRRTKSPGRTSTAQDKNVSKRYPNGRTLRTKDEYLPTKKGKRSDNPKDERWVAVIDSNQKDELAVVRLTRQNQSNTTYLPTYKKGNGERSFFKHFVETKDNAGGPIKVDGKKFKENAKNNDLTREEVLFVRDKVLGHVKQSSENKKKIATLKENGDV